MLPPTLDGRFPSDARGLWSVEKREPRQKPLSSHMELVHNVHTVFPRGDITH